MFMMKRLEAFCVHDEETGDFCVHDEETGDFLCSGELGDFLINDHVNNSYLSSFNFLPKEQQTAEFLDKVIHYHQQYMYVQTAVCVTR